MTTYKIIRQFRDGRPRQVITRGQDLSQAQAHCRDPRTRLEGEWFDCYESDDPKPYNGWTNYETWNVALWCDNERAVYDERAEKQRAEPWTPESVESFVTQYFPGGLTPDIASLDPTDREPVCWHEIAHNWNQEQFQ